MTVSVSASPLRFLVRLFLLGGLLVLATSPVQAQQDRVIEKTMDLAPEGDVAVVAERGRIRVEGWDRSVVEVTAQVRDWEADRADRSPVSIEKEGSTVRIKTVDADPDGAGLWRLIGLGGAEGPVTNYSVRMPASASLSVTTQEGSVEIQGLASEVVAEGYSASMEIRDLSGKVTAATYSGPLRAENVRGPVTVATFSGDMTVRGPAPATKHTVASFSGDAEIAFPADAAFDLQTSISWGGGITSDFPMPDSTGRDEGPIPIGGGGPTVTFESFSGSLTLRAE